MKNPYETEENPLSKTVVIDEIIAGLMIEQELRYEQKLERERREMEEGRRKYRVLKNHTHRLSERYHLGALVEETTHAVARKKSWSANIKTYETGFGNSALNPAHRQQYPHDYKDYELTFGIDLDDGYRRMSGYFHIDVRPFFELKPPSFANEIQDDLKFSIYYSSEPATTTRPEGFINDRTTGEFQRALVKSLLDVSFGGRYFGESTASSYSFHLDTHGG